MNDDNVTDDHHSEHNDEEKNAVTTFGKYNVQWRL